MSIINATTMIASDKSDIVEYVGSFSVTSSYNSHWYDNPSYTLYNAIATEDRIYRLITDFNGVRASVNSASGDVTLSTIDSGYRYNSSKVINVYMVKPNGIEYVGSGSLSSGGTKSSTSSLYTISNLEFDDDYVYYTDAFRCIGVRESHSSLPNPCNIWRINRKYLQTT